MYIMTQVRDVAPGPFVCMLYVHVVIHLHIVKLCMYIDVEHLAIDVSTLQIISVPWSWLNVTQYLSVYLL
jgi:hypothetical protein